MVDTLMAQMCQAWPKGASVRPTSTPRSRADLPVLVLTGELDPVTPPRYGEQIAATRACPTVAPG
jgi:alpha-beta hydrolase superfamily lysophospholipase